jgi:hypothetical protein
MVTSVSFLWPPLQSPNFTSCYYMNNFKILVYFKA